MSVSAYHQHHNNHGHHNNNHNNHHQNNNNGHNNKRQQRLKDSRALRDLKVKQNKHILSTYNKAYAFFPKVCAVCTGSQPAKQQAEHSTAPHNLSSPSHMCWRLCWSALLCAGQVCAQAQQPHGRGVEAVWQRQ